MNPGEDRHVTEYWLEHYVGERSLCVLCANTGMVNTVPRATLTGAKTFCICPNGQVRRHAEKKK